MSVLPSASAVTQFNTLERCTNDFRAAKLTAKRCRPAPPLLAHTRSSSTPPQCCSYHTFLNTSDVSYASLVPFLVVCCFVVDILASLLGVGGNGGRGCRCWAAGAASRSERLAHRTTTHAHNHHHAAANREQGTDNASC